MRRILYYLIRIFRLNLRYMGRKIDEVHRKCGKNKFAVFFDMIWCGFRYGAGYTDYALFEMYALDGRKRATILTRFKNNKYVAALNLRKDWPYFDNKVMFHEKFAEFCGRRYLDLASAPSEVFSGFLACNPVFIAKPVDGTCGMSIEKYDVRDYPDHQVLYDLLRSKSQRLIEQPIRQHPVLDAIYPHSVNSVRLVTLVKDGVPHFVFSSIRIGNGGRCVDNFNSGGMLAPVRIGDGVIEKPAVDKSGALFDSHPMTGTPITGAQIPFWRQCLDLAAKASLVVPGIRYVGWDIAVTPDGPTLIEGNHFPGHDLYNLPAHTSERIGIFPAFNEVIPYKSLK